MEELPDYKITNVVATFNLGKNVFLDIQSISETSGYFEYNPKKFAAATGRLKNPKCSGLFFNSGSVVLTGADSENGARKAAWCFVSILVSLGCSVTVCNFKIQNIVCSISCKRNIKLYELHANNLLESNYMPVLFPGLIYRYPYPAVVFVNFLTGNVIGTGAKVRQELEQGWSEFYHKKLKHYFDDGSTVKSSSEYRIKKRREHDNTDQFIQRLQQLKRRRLKRSGYDASRFVSLDTLEQSVHCHFSFSTLMDVRMASTLEAEHSRT